MLPRCKKYVIAYHKQLLPIMIKYIVKSITYVVFLSVFTTGRNMVLWSPSMAMSENFRRIYEP